jgi:hypothetical protein
MFVITILVNFRRKNGYFTNQYSSNLAKKTPKCLSIFSAKVIKKS